jgi:hypothetical protein
MILWLKSNAKLLRRDWIIGRIFGAIKLKGKKRWARTYNVKVLKMFWLRDVICSPLEIADFLFKPAKLAS